MDSVSPTERDGKNTCEVNAIRVALATDATLPLACSPPVCCVTFLVSSESCRQVLRQHNRGQIRIRSGHVRHDGRIHHAQALGADHPARWIHHGPGIVRRAHPARPTGMPKFVALGTQPGIEPTLLRERCRAEPRGPDHDRLDQRGDRRMLRQRKKSPRPSLRRPYMPHATGSQPPPRLGDVCWRGHSTRCQACRELPIYEKQHLENARRTSVAQRSGNSRVAVHLWHDCASNMESAAETQELTLRGNE